jgi:hypothetical protein
MQNALDILRGFTRKGQQAKQQEEILRYTTSSKFTMHLHAYYYIYKCLTTPNMPAQRTYGSINLWNAMAKSFKIQQYLEATRPFVIVVSSC